MIKIFEGKTPEVEKEYNEWTEMYKDSYIFKKIEVLPPTIADYQEGIFVHIVIVVHYRRMYT